ncbi:hypothetical protein RRG08_043681 [Elysia crispata]|uniref:Uncharacterized protein n=1 Tax=Elysia crispata TaxID=231223 RepID=A0AAE1DMB2_9GAST|nr:hypothetical protein RRG08_043681 [Elysia crispata]
MTLHFHLRPRDFVLDVYCDVIRLGLCELYTQIQGAPSQFSIEKMFGLPEGSRNYGFQFYVKFAYRFYDVDLLLSQDKDIQRDVLRIRDLTLAKASDVYKAAASAGRHRRTMNMAPQALMLSTPFLNLSVILIPHSSAFLTSSSFDKLQTLLSAASYAQQ